MKFLRALIIDHFLASTYLEAIQNVASSLSDWSKYIEDRTVCYFSRLMFGNRSMLFDTIKSKIIELFHNLKDKWNVLMVS